jgi:nucleoid DNA-binding protein
VNKSDIINLVCEKNNLGLSDVEYSIKKIIDFMSELERRNTVHFKPSKELKSRVNNI